MLDLIVMGVVMTILMILAWIVALCVGLAYGGAAVVREVKKQPEILEQSTGLKNEKGSTVVDKIKVAAIEKGTKIAIEKLGKWWLKR